MFVNNATLPLIANISLNLSLEFCKSCMYVLCTYGRKLHTMDLFYKGKNINLCFKNLIKKFYLYAGSNIISI